MPRSDILAASGLNLYMGIIKNTAIYEFDVNKVYNIIVSTVE